MKRGQTWEEAAWNWSTQQQRLSPAVTLHREMAMVKGQRFAYPLPT